ncbi:MAG: GNAT family N-acetyltransferase [Chloroflexi bacterium]|nr:GNAT family N-acetyltransferase [Chloroflexota bacterium]MYB83929.1 GNAT family N-acetyltransferase [Chloroflexota bacterium]
MMADEVTFEAVTPAHPDAEALMALLDAEVLDIYSDAGDVETGALSDELKAAFNGVFLVARRNGAPVACGGVLVMDEAMCELRRVYAVPGERGTGLARRLIAELERAASGLGMSRIALETGDRQTRAIGFYEALGYSQIPLYGEHEGKWWAICYEKRILPANITFEPATPDVPEVAALLTDYEKEFLSFNTREETGWLGSAAHQGLEMMLVRRDGRPVGCGGIRMEGPKTAELKRMYVIPDERSRGIATELVSRLERAAAEQGATRMVLDTTPRMETAVRLYERLGYVRTQPFLRHNSGAGMPALIYFEKALA